MALTGAHSQSDYSQRVMVITLSEPYSYGPVLIA